MTALVEHIGAPRLFTPSTMSGSRLDALTVGSGRVPDVLTGRVQAAARDGSRPHTLVVAPSGAGKTHTLHVALHRALDDPATDQAVLPVVIPEPALGIGRYADLLVEAARAIGPEALREAQMLRSLRDPVGIEGVISDAAGGRMVLLVIENLDRVFRALGADGQGSFRAWVETSAAVMVVGSAPALFEGVSSRLFPWYGSFIIETLAPLSVADAITLLLRAARRRRSVSLEAAVESQRGRRAVEELHRRVGGWPRVWQLIAGVVDAEGLLRVDPAVDLLLDRLVDHYRPRLWNLPAGEQRLVVELARGAGARTVADLAAAVGVSSQSASGALGRLTAAGWVCSSKADADRRTSWYELADPLVRPFVQYRERRG